MGGAREAQAGDTWPGITVIQDPPPGVDQIDVTGMTQRSGI
jgi:hypothetical protein